MSKNVDMIELSKTDPKKAINTFLLSSMASVFLINLNYLVDSFWVSGLSADALTAMGLVVPLWNIINGIGRGYGEGINSTISRFASMGKNEDANNAVIHGIILAVIAYFIFLIIGLFFLDTIIIWLGGASLLPLCKAYIMPVFILSIFLMAPEVNAGLYRAAGDVKRSSDSFVVLAILNIILDPIFIYILNFGIAGASYATVVASLCSLIYMNMGQDFMNDIVRPIRNLNYEFKLSILKEIFVVSSPVVVNDLAHSIFSIIVNYLIIFTAGVDEIASYVIVKQLIRFVSVPADAIGSVFVTVSGVTYSSKLWNKFEEGLNYATVLTLIGSVILTLILFIFPHQVCGIFSLTLSDLGVIERASEILMIMAFLYILSPLLTMGIKSFQGMGKGLFSLLLSLLSQVILTLIFAYLLGIILNMGVLGVYLGLVVGYSLASIISFSIIKLYIPKLKKESDINVQN